MPALVVEGLAGLERAFALAGKEFEKGLTSDLKHIAEPIRIDAERRAVTEITNIGEPWSRMRSVARRNLVYVAPTERSRQSRRNPALRRPNLAPLLMDRAMQPALDAHVGQVEASFDELLDKLGRNWERF